MSNSRVYSARKQVTIRLVALVAARDERVIEKVRFSNEFAAVHTNTYAQKFDLLTHTEALIGRLISDHRELHLQFTSQQFTIYLLLIFN